jgi:hypothetical protein
VLPDKSEKCFWLQNLGKPLLVSKFVANLLFINFAKKKKKNCQHLVLDLENVILV